MQTQRSYVSVFVCMEGKATTLQLTVHAPKTFGATSSYIDQSVKAMADRLAALQGQQVMSVQRAENIWLEV